MAQSDCNDIIKEFPEDRRDYKSLCAVIQKFDFRITAIEQNREIVRVKRDNRFKNIQIILDKLEERMLALEIGLFGNGTKDDSINFLLRVLIKEFKEHIEVHESIGVKVWDIVKNLITYVALLAVGALLTQMVGQM